MKKLMILPLLALALLSCKKEENNNTNNGPATLKVSITDAPGDYKNIILQVKEIAVKNANWEVLTLLQTDSFDILDYTNGNALLLAADEVSAESTSEIRLVLADDNYLVLEDGSVHNLKVPSGSTSGLKIKLDKTKTLQSGQTYFVVLDFDASKSIVKKGNGTYSLKPVIRGYWNEGLGAAEGIATSIGYQVSVHAVNGTDTLGGTIADSASGYYKIGGLPQATLSFYYSSTNGKDTAIGGVGILQNNTTVIDSVDLN